MRGIGVIALTAALLISSVSFAELSESVLQDEVASGLKTGRIQQIPQDGGSFYSIYTETERSRRQGVLVMLHGEGGNPDQKPLFHLLRHQLVKRGWVSLSLQLPPTEVNDDWESVKYRLPEAVARVGAALSFIDGEEALREKPIVFLGVGYGAVSAAQWLVDNEKTGKMAGLICIDWPIDSQEKGLREAAVLESGTLPLLDVYSGMDQPINQQLAERRRVLLRNREQYRQLAFSLSPELASASAEMLVNQLIAWIKQLPTVTESGE